MDEATTPDNLPQPATDGKAAKHPKAYQITFRVNEAEYNHIEKIAKARIEAGFSIDKGHFARQCVDFAINNNAVPGAKTFSVPDDVEPRLLENGFYIQHIKNIPICK